VLGDDLGHQRVDGKAVARKADGGLRDLAEAHGAEALERRDPGIGRRRHHRPQDAPRNRAAIMLLEVIARNRLGPGAEAGDGEDAIIRGGIDDDRSNPGNVHEFRLHDPERDAACNPGVDRIAARLQDAKTGLGRKILCGGDHVACAHDGRAVGLHGVLPGLSVPDFATLNPGYTTLCAFAPRLHSVGAGFKPAPTTHRSPDAA
jgi:hypothetical protein